MQMFLLAAHQFLYRTWIVFHPALPASAAQRLHLALLTLAFSFIAAALLSFRFSNWLVTLLYKVAALWLGLLNFFFLAACCCRLIFFLPLGRFAPDQARLSDLFFALALLVSLYGMVNARWLRLRRIGIALPNLPRQWHGRTALLVSDLHLGNVNGTAFAGKIARLATELKPDLLFIAGDLFDGTKADPARLIAPFGKLALPCGIFLSIGNHEEFGGTAEYIAALRQAQIQVLDNRKAVVDGLQIAGINFTDSTYPQRLRMILEGLALDSSRASILLNHAPTRLPIVEQAGINLQLSGHTHRGQLFPFTWITRRVFGKFTYGLQRFSNLQVYTSSGAGTWGPPMRVGSSPEAVLFRFE